MSSSDEATVSRHGGFDSATVGVQAHLRPPRPAASTPLAFILILLAVPDSPLGFREEAVVAVGAALTQPLLRPVLVAPRSLGAPVGGPISEAAAGSGRIWSHRPISGPRPRDRAGPA